VATLASDAVLRDEAGRRPAPGKARASAIPLILVCIAVCAGLQLHLVWTQAINWDEFRFLSDVYALERGDLGLAVQTFHVHFFRWLIGRFGNEIDQVIAARFVMLACEAVTAGLIYATCRRFVDASSALLAVMAFVSFGFVLRYGASFRYDPIVTALLMGAVYLLLATRLNRVQAITAGTLVAIAGLVTMKSVFYLPLLGAVAVYRLLQTSERRRLAVNIALGGASCLAVFAGLYWLHSSAVTVVDGSGAVVAASASKTLGRTMLFPRWVDLVRSILSNPLQWLLLATGVGTVATRAFAAPRGSRALAWLPFAFLVPLMTLAVYRNAYPYFYVFMLAPAALPIAIAAARADVRRLAPVLALALAASAIANYLPIDRDVLKAQRETLAAVHAIFPEPVAAIDRSSMAASFPQAGLFMSTWGMEQYRSEGRPVMREAFAERHAVLLIDNSRWLSEALRDKDSGEGLLREDAATLRENLVHHWGPIWVAGKALALAASSRQFEILVPGRYTLESAGSVAIDGQVRWNGEVIQLAAGTHLAASADVRSAVLRWGDHLPKPRRAEPSGVLFEPF
jgi:hypothetical protein